MAAVEAKGGGWAVAETGAEVREEVEMAEADSGAEEMAAGAREVVVAAAMAVADSAEADSAAVATVVGAGVRGELPTRACPPSTAAKAPSRAGALARARILRRRS
mmetsp:Transcript_25872/g.85130  ORF Transcript_25872/g.85130 Transcript_25872/m.85130 type:complete len:105 (-) Transcript_25872:199-513(-)